MAAATTASQLPWGLLPFLLLYFIASAVSAHASHVHVVYLGVSSHNDTILTAKSHLRLLSTVFSSEDEAERALVYSYKHSFSGFAAMLSSAQAATLAGTEGVISVFRSRTLRLHTTRSWDFMGLTLDQQGESLPLQLAYGSDVVIGVLDTGIWPESASFREDPNAPPPPPGWSGACVPGERFDPKTVCNRKLVGAKFYAAGFEKEFGPLNATGDGEYRSPRDRLGHGTHTASTAAGAAVGGASFFGRAAGTARGGAPLARLAVYKVCWLRDLQGRCTEADILAAFDEAVADGVGVISASFGAVPPLTPLFASSSGIGSFHAAQRGVSVVFSAGNEGPEMELVQNVAPWGICVAAATVDRTFPVQLLLGNNASVTGVSFTAREMETRLAESTRYFDDGVCDYQKWKGTLLATGAAVLCFSTVGQVSSAAAALAVLAINGTAVIFAEPLTRRVAQDDLIPSIHVDIHQGTQLLYYIQSTRDPTAKVVPGGTAVGRSLAPSVAYFSSRGPNSMSPSILKPDVTAPGVNILAAWPPESPPTLLPIDPRRTSWNFDSGTSMSCPHVSGVVALLRSAHPDWSPAAIKSALMTTAYATDTSHDRMLARGTMKAADAFDAGAGHVNPTQALDPGLVYDASTRDYILHICSMGYTEAQIARMVLPSPATDTTCPGPGHAGATDLNYPAIVLPDLRARATVMRTLRNVDGRRCRVVYCATVTSPNGVRVAVEPRRLVFSGGRDSVSYTATFTPVKRSEGRYDFGEIVWSDGRHSVRTPLAVRVNNTGGEADWARPVRWE